MTTDEQKIERPFEQSILLADENTELLLSNAKMTTAEQKIERPFEESIPSAKAKKVSIKKKIAKKLAIDEEANTVKIFSKDAPVVDEPVVEKVEEDEETQLKRRLAEIQSQKKAKEVRHNIGELRETLKTYQRGLIAKAEEELAKLKRQLADVDTGAFDEDLIAKALRKTPIKINAEGEVVKKSAGVAGEGENRARAVRKLNADDAKEKKVLSAFTKRVGEYRWGLHRGGTITALDKQGVYSMPLWKEQNATMVVEGKNSFKTIKEFKEWILENNK